MPQILLFFNAGLSKKFFWKTKQPYQVGKLLDKNREFQIKIPYTIPTPFQHPNSRRFKENIPVFQRHFVCLKLPILQNLLPDSQKKTIISQGHSRSGNHNHPKFGNRYHMPHLTTNGADLSLKIPWLQWKIPDAVPNSLTIPWFFVKMREFFKFPDNSLILLILQIAVNSAISKKRTRQNIFT